MKDTDRKNNLNTTTNTTKPIESIICPIPFSASTVDYDIVTRMFRAINKVNPDISDNGHLGKHLSSIAINPHDSPKLVYLVDNKQLYWCEQDSLDTHLVNRNAAVSMITPSIKEFTHLIIHDNKGTLESFISGNRTVLVTNTPKASHWNCKCSKCNQDGYDSGMSFTCSNGCKQATGVFK